CLFRKAGERFSIEAVQACVSGAHPDVAVPVLDRAPGKELAHAFCRGEVAECFAVVAPYPRLAFKAVVVFHAAEPDVPRSIHQQGLAELKWFCMTGKRLSIVKPYP